jgi:hypothetical protein
LKLPSALVAILLTIEIAACDQHPVKAHIDPGWQVTWQPVRNFVTYGFGDASGTYFSGICDIHPVFVLLRGGYGSGVSKFKLTIDGQSWTLNAFQGEHSRGLFVDDPSFADRFANAKNDITFETDDGWKRSFRPAPELARFIQECRSLRQRDPDATGREAHWRDAL